MSNTVLICDSRNEPTDAQIEAAKAQGVRGWMGYYGPGAAHDWSAAGFARVRAHGLSPGVVAFPVPGSDPAAAGDFARSIGAVLWCDNARGDGVDPYDPTTRAWMAMARAHVWTAMYAQPDVLHYWAGNYDGAVACGVGGDSNNPLNLPVPSGNQNWNGDIAGITVDRGVYDVAFLGAPMNPTMYLYDQGGAIYLFLPALGRLVHLTSTADVAALRGEGVPFLTVVDLVSDIQRDIPVTAPAVADVQGPVTGTVELKIG